MKIKLNDYNVALAYLRTGSPLGGAPVEALIKKAADAIDPSCKTQLQGPGVAIPAIEQAIRQLVWAHGEVMRAHGAALAKEDARRQKRSKR